jgi:hypothetical protein
MRKTITYCILIIAGAAVIAVFVTAKTYAQLAVASALYLPLAYFAYKLFPRKAWRVRLKKPEVSVHTVDLPETQVKHEDMIVDFDRRAFLKLVGATGLSFFLFSILTKRAEPLLFGTGASPLGTNEPQPTDGYQISEIDENDPTYCGFVNKNGGWYIIKQNADGSFRYAKGESDFPGNWANRKNLKYDYFSNVFS